MPQYDITVSFEGGKPETDVESEKSLEAAKKHAAATAAAMKADLGVDVKVLSVTQHVE